MPCAPGTRSQAALLVLGFRLSPLWLSVALSLSAPCLKTASVFSTSVRFYLSYYSSITMQLRYRRVLLCGDSFTGSSDDCLRTRHLVRCTGKRRQANVEYALAGSCADLALTFIVLFLCLLSRFAALLVFQFFAFVARLFPIFSLPTFRSAERRNLRVAVPSSHFSVGVC